MKLHYTLAISLLLISGLSDLNAQTYLKLNGLYALVGVINPAVEITISPKSTFQSEIIYSPWQRIRDNGYDKPMHFGIFMNEYRRYFKEHNRGWYLGLNGSFMGFKMSKPEFKHGKLSLEDRYCKGYGLMVGLCGGYEYIFKKKWILDAYFGWAFMISWYNGYELDGQIQMHPHRPVEPRYPDPFNGSTEWYPNKIGLSVGLMIFDPNREKKSKQDLL